MPKIIQKIHVKIAHSLDCKDRLLTIKGPAIPENAMKNGNMSYLIESRFSICHQYHKASSTALTSLQLVMNLSFFLLNTVYAVHKYTTENTHTHTHTHIHTLISTDCVRSHPPN